MGMRHCDLVNIRYSSYESSKWVVNILRTKNKFHTKTSRSATLPKKQTKKHILIEIVFLASSSPNKELCALRGFFGPHMRLKYKKWCLTKLLLLVY